MKKFIAVLAIFIATGSFAFVKPASAATKQSSVDVSNLTAEQVAQINQKVSEMKQDPKNISASVRQEAEAWGELGANMGKAMVGAAREVGVAANEFSNTSLGQIVVGIVTYKVVGREILGVLFGSLTLLVGWSLAIWFFTTTKFSQVKYEYEPILFGLIKRQRVKEVECNNDTAQMQVLLAGLTLVLSSVVGFNMIF